MSLVQFWIYCEGDVFLSPKIDPEEPIGELLEQIAVRSARPQQLTGAVLLKSTLYKFDSPVPSRNPIQAVVAGCRDAKKDVMWETFNVKDLAGKEKLCVNYVCLVIETPKGQHDKVVGELQRNHGALFAALQISVAIIHDFSEGDVTGNLAGGRFWRHREERADHDISKLESELATRRVYTPNVAGHPGDIDIAKRYLRDFAVYCAAAAGTEADNHAGHTIMNSREFIAFFSLFRCHVEDAERIANLAASSSMKANHIASHFLLPAFFTCPPSNSKLVFTSEMTWNFPIFLATTTESSTLCKYKPRSDFGVCVNGFGLPLLMCEVISMKKESDRWRMLLQGIAAARAMHCIKKENSNTSLFIAAIYVRSNLVAERYIIEANGPAGKVAIAQKDFDLRLSADSREFLKELYNLQDKLHKMAEALDDDKEDALSNIAKAAMPITSYTQRAKESQKTTTKSKSTRTKGTSDLGSVPEEEADFTQDDDVQNSLRNMGYVLDFVVYGHPNVAMISRASNPTDRGFLKFTRAPTEVQILEYLSEIVDPDNHTISGVNAWPRECGGFVIYTSSGGGHLTDLRQPDEHAWSAAKQLVAGVAFMHKHNVAHLDIKPSNVHIPVGGGRLSINDFSVAVRIRTPSKKYRGTVGTEGYMAPEIVAKDAYDPIRADLWSCGKTLLELISRCGRATREREFLVEISRQLMDDNPLERPMMSDVLAQMAVLESCIVDLPVLRFSSPMVASRA